MSERKLVVIGIPWDVDTEGLREYMIKFGDLEDCIVMKERATGRSRGFGYVTFATVEDAKNALSKEHFLGNIMLEVKVATPKEEMRAPAKEETRIFVARIPPFVSEANFRSYFEKYGEITDLYMPKDPTTKGHRGIGFITFANAESVDDLMSDTHELGGSTIVVDRATPKEDFRPVSRMSHSQCGGYGAYNAYISATTRYAALDAPTLYDHPSSMYGRGGYSSHDSMGNKIFVGRLPQEATTEDLRQYFGRFGRVLDVYVPKDPKGPGHRGFGFVTFADDGVADRVSRRPHEICGHQGDVIVSFDGVYVGCDGTVPFRSSERIAFRYLISQKFTGDSVELGIIRAGEFMKVQAVLKPRVHLVPYHIEGGQPSYLIVAGLVFTPLSDPLIEEEEDSIGLKLLTKARYSSAKFKGSRLLYYPRSWRMK